MSRTIDELDAITTSELSGRPEHLLLVLWGLLARAEAGLAIDGDRDVAASLTARG